MNVNNLVLDTDSYKLSHFRQYPTNTKSLFAYLESRGGRYGKTVFFGLQPIIQRISAGVTAADVVEAAEFAKAHGEPFPIAGWQHIVNDLGGKIPIRVRAVPEGSVVPVRNALMTVEATDPEVPWVVTWFETQLMRVWYPTTVCTKSFYCVRTIFEFLRDTANDPMSELPFKLHDFGSRGVSSRESAGIGGAAHLVNSKGTDTIEGAIYADHFYGGAKAMEGGVAGFSIPAMEHSTVTSWGKEAEARAFANMIDQHPEFNILACVSDSYDIDKAVEQIWCDDLLEKVKASGKLIVIRPDSGPPAETTVRLLHIMERKIGMSINSKGYKVLPPYFRLIWGDGNKTEDDIRSILSAMKQEKFSASNIAFGMGGGLLQLVDRDTQMFAYKTSAAFIDGKWTNVMKEPKTDAHKVSKAGRLDLVKQDGDWKTIQLPAGAPGKPDAMDFVQTKSSELVTVFENGEVKKTWTFDEIRKRAQHALLEG